MLQSIKRAHKLDANNPKLHSCLIRFYEFINQSKNDWEPAVEEVIKQEMKLLLDDKNAKQLNKEFLERHSKSLEHVLEAAKMMYYLDRNNQNDALSLITNLDNNYHDVNIQVSCGKPRNFCTILLFMFSVSELYKCFNNIAEWRIGSVRYVYRRI